MPIPASMTNTRSPINMRITICLPVIFLERFPFLEFGSGRIVVLGFPEEFCGRERTGLPRDEEFRGRECTGLPRDEEFCGLLFCGIP